MGTFKLSFEASEIDDKLKVIEDGGAGYTDETGTVHTINPKYLPDEVVNQAGKLVENGQVGYEEGKIILPKNNYPAGHEADGRLDIAAGKKYIVTVNGIEHIVEAAEDDGFVFLEGDNFDVGNDIENNVYYVSVFGDNGDIGGEVMVTTDPYAIHPIDPKFLPGVCLPVVELEITDSTSQLITDENVCARLDELYKSAPAILAKFTMGELSICAIMCHAYTGLTDGFLMPGTSNGIMRTDGGSSWTLFFSLGG